MLECENAPTTLFTLVWPCTYLPYVLNKVLAWPVRCWKFADTIFREIRKCPVAERYYRCKEKMVVMMLFWFPWLVEEELTMKSRPSDGKNAGFETEFVKYTATILVDRWQ